jgi:UDP-glucose 4-epimerase
MNTKVVVIGGAGFLGSHIADELTQMGYAVTIFDLSSSVWLQAGQEMVVGDIFDVEVLQNCVQGSKYVFHLAGIADIGEAAARPLDSIKSNILGTASAIEACIKAGVERFVFASTVYVYSQRGSFYRASKQAAEALVETYHEKFGLNYTILRYGSLYGPRAQDWNGVKRFVRQAIREGRIQYGGTGDERREYIHVQDAAQLSVSALKSEYANSCLTITGTQVLKGRELMSMIQEIMGNSITVDYSSEALDHDHYILTPYRYTPKTAKKIVPNTFIDIGQGILDVVEEIHNEIDGNKSAEDLHI